MRAFSEWFATVGKPVPPEQLEAFARTMREKVIPKSEKYRREQAKLAAEARRRIVF